jgi:hypothetical protein
MFVLAQLRFCRSLISAPTTDIILRWEHKVLKTFVKQFACSAPLGLAIGVGHRTLYEGAEAFYLRTIDCGSLSLFAKNLLSVTDLRIFQDCVMTASDEQRLCSEQSITRAKVIEQLKEAFHNVISDLKSAKTVCAYLCVVDRKRVVHISSYGLERIELSLQKCAKNLLETPHSQSAPVSNPKDLCSTSSLQEQLLLLNSLPAQCISQSSKYTRTPIYVSWPTNAPKHLLLQGAPSGTIIEAFHFTAASSILVRSRKKPVQKRKRTIDRHMLFLKRLANTTNEIKARKVVSGLSQHTFQQTLSPVQLFQAEMCTRGHARVIAFNDRHCEIVWNKFDAIHS